MVENTEKYWIIVNDPNGALLFRVSDDGWIEYGPEGTPEACRKAFENWHQGF